MGSEKSYIYRKYIEIIKSVVNMFVKYQVYSFY